MLGKQSRFWHIQHRVILRRKKKKKASLKYMNSYQVHQILIQIQFDL